VSGGNGQTILGSGSGDLKQRGQGELAEVLIDRIIETKRRLGNRKDMN
jgi:hypothetical protein